MYQDGVWIEENCFSISARLPWMSIDACSFTREIFVCESQPVIDKCLNCRKAVCDGCRQKQKNQTKQSQFRKLYRKGKSQKQICEQLNISRATYFNYKRQLQERSEAV